MDEKEFHRKIQSAGGELFIVGGWVRDRILGLPPRDRDYVVTGLYEEVFASALPNALRTGGSFPVYRMKVDGVRCEIALARSEAKSGRGHRGFSVEFSPRTSIEEDLFRRDTTINSIAYSLKTGEYIDPYGGILDIASRVIRATSEHFTDDPVRALRAARQSAETGFSVEERTLRLMGGCREEIALEPKERLVGELAKALSSAAPARFFRSLEEAGILDVSYPQIHALTGGNGQNRGKIFERAMRAIDRSAGLTSRTEVRFASLAQYLVLEALVEWGRYMPLPNIWMKCARFAVTERPRVLGIDTPEAIADFIAKMENSLLGIDGLKAVIASANEDIPELLERYDCCLSAYLSVGGKDAPRHLKGKEVGCWLKQRRAEAIAEAACHWESQNTGKK